MTPSISKTRQPIVICDVESDTVEESFRQSSVPIGSGQVGRSAVFPIFNYNLMTYIAEFPGEPLWPRAALHSHPSHLKRRPRKSAWPKMRGTREIRSVSHSATRSIAGGEIAQNSYGVGRRS